MAWATIAVMKKKAGKTAPLRAKGPVRLQIDPFLGQLGDRTRRLRARNGLTRRELAKEADVSERHLANLETGVGNPSVQILRQLARALNCSVAELVGDECE